jgi:guanine deaminase
VNQSNVTDRFIEEAIALASENARTGKGGPFGAVVVKDNIAIACGTNRVTASTDPTAHAEVVAIRAACASLASFDLSGCVLYSSCEPCPMCLAAIYWARMDRFYFAASRQDAAAAGFDDARIYRELVLHPSERSILGQQINSPRAGGPFDDWRAALVRIPY